MSTKVQQLLIIQDRDRQISRLTREISDIPERRKLIESQLDAHKKALEAAEDVIRKKGLEQKDLEAQIDARKERIQKIRQQQFEVKNNDDYRNYEKLIVAINEEILGIEERDLVLMEDVERLHALRDEKQQALTEEKKVVNEEVDRLQQRAGNIEKECEEVKRVRAGLADAFDPSWLSRYERLYAHFGDYGIVPVENNTCGGCHMKLPPQATHDARKLDQMTTCMYCGRLLYFMP